MSDYLDPNNEELLKDFFYEANSQVELLEHNIMAIEDNPEDHDSIDEIFRAAHTLKGGAATVQMSELADFTHLVEDLLDEIRSDKIKINEQVIDSLLASIDVIKEMLLARSGGTVYEDDISSLKKTLKSLSEGKKAGAALPVGSETLDKKEISSQTPELSEYDVLELKDAAGGLPVIQVAVSFDESNPMNSVGGIQVYAKLKNLGQILKTVPEFDKLYEDEYHPQVLYYISSESDPAIIESEAFIWEVTDGVEAIILGNEKKAVQSQEKISRPVAPPKTILQPAAQEKQKEESVKEKKAEGSVEENNNNEISKATKGIVNKNKSKDTSGSILRVDSKRIDNLLNLVSEAVINKATFNQINSSFTDIQNELQNAESSFKEKLKTLFDDLPQYLEDIHKNKSVKDIKKEINEKYEDLFTIFDSFEGNFKQTVGTFKSTAANLGRNTGDLHEAILKIRMVPINQIFSRFPRLVRDLSKSLNKNIKLTIEGEDTELDKSVIEELLDPLMHCVRNSLDHGIENPDVRVAAGKSDEGLILLKASNEGNMIVIEIADDGAGIDVDNVKRKAIDRGIIHPSKNLSDVEAFNLIFEPGFSTAKEVTNISGRGVGLDVVRKEIEKLNGTVTVLSTRNKGTRFIIKLPLTLAIIQGLLVRVGTEVYAIPITSVIESHRIKPEEIKIIDNHEVFNVRDDVISLVRMNRLFRLNTEESEDYNFIVIVGSGDKKMGVMVDSLIGEEDVVIKPLKDKYTNSPGIAGATILGDGTVSLIIDVSQLLDLCIQKEQATRLKRSQAY
ncbi:chemotaxis protein CheA [Oceanispirochaeta sp.]|jgi:two-component system chemotaxis sensor kinase CheA|uniref:chemotaxis protein CheA n=1 Tax=Oceanispirochaeta sp. TaxID=2035350 RepID=UPI002612EC94|nr:chemotaxis protein CheA [Oceanispirochaeta sp.]MDA3955791.1 chemotaxis protein CheA [Oceanispirochaeta sp.]